MLRRRNPCLAVLVGLSIWLAACAPTEPTSVSGVVTDLRAADLTTVQQFTLRDRQGQLWTFVVAGDAIDETGRPLNASHLREHMTFGLEVTVDFQRDGGTLVAKRVFH